MINNKKRYFMFGGFNTLQVLKYGLTNDDLHLLSYIKNCNNSSQLEKINENDNYYVWLKNEKIIEDNPTLYFKESMLKIKVQNLLKKEMIDKIVKCQKGTSFKKSYYRTTDKFDELKYLYVENGIDNVQENFYQDIDININNKNTLDYNVDKLFNDFWITYPRKIGKGNCEKWFKTHKPTKEIVSEMIMAIIAQKKTEQWIKDKGQYIPHPYTWLNGKRWEDEIGSLNNNGRTIINGVDCTETINILNKDKF